MRGSVLASPPTPMTHIGHDESERFQREVEERIDDNGSNTALAQASAAWMELADAARYEYNFTWMGRPVIQFPQDLIALQEIIWRTRPDAIIETGVAHGGSTVFYASMLALLGGERRVVSVDVEIRPHNRAAIEAHPMFQAGLIRLVEGSSTDDAIVARVRALVEGSRSILVCLDSNHSHEHVLGELTAYAPLVRRGGYIVVLDTSIETIQTARHEGKPWRHGSNPHTAVAEFLRRDRRFALDRRPQRQLMITSAPDGFLVCVEDSP